ARKMLFAAILSICASSSKKISIYNEEMIVARCFIGFIIFSRKSLGKTFKMTLDGRIQAIQEESQQFPNPNEVVPPESNEQQRLLRISLRICGTVVESLPMARCAPKCEKTVQAFLCRNLNVKSATLPNATSSRRIRLQDDLVTGFHFSVSERFVPGSTLKVSIVELIREGLGVLKMVRVGEERIQYQDDFFLRKCSKYLRNSGISCPTTDILTDKINSRRRKAMRRCLGAEASAHLIRLLPCQRRSACLVALTGTEKSVKRKDAGSSKDAYTEMVFLSIVEDDSKPTALPSEMLLEMPFHKRTLPLLLSTSLLS
ncbi:UNVERIFIED_CONTAM: ATP synthase protein MI25, partial [Sesamum indicum]